MDTVTAPSTVPTIKATLLRALLIILGVVRAIIDFVVAAVILSHPHGGQILGVSRTGIAAAGAIFFGVAYVMLTIAVLRRWRRYALVAIPILVIEAVGTITWFPAVVIIGLLVIPYTRRQLLR